MRGRGKWLLVLTGPLLVLTLARPVLSPLSTPGPAPGNHSRDARQQSGQPEEAGEFTVQGCLSGTEFLLGPDRDYRLTGNTTALRSHNGEYVAIRVKKSPNQLPPFTDITVEIIGFEKVLLRPRALLDPSVSDSSRWLRHANKKYGVELAVPDSFHTAPASRVFADPEFVNPQGVIALASFAIPTDTYSHANFTWPSGYHPAAFAGGSFAVFVNPEITNRPSCLQFGNPFPASLSWQTFAGVGYRGLDRYGAAAGTGYDFYAFHTFQNGLCYAVAVELVQVNTANFDQGCMIPVVTPHQEKGLIQHLLSQVAFFRPRIALARPKPLTSTPVVLSFTASSRLANNLPARSYITFSWSTRNADYVRLSCQYPSDKAKTTRAGDTRTRSTKGSSLFSAPRCEQDTLDYSPNGSAAVFFNNRQDEPITVPVSITPFSHALPYPTSSKTITITVARYSPWPEGVPIETKNITVLSPVSGNGPLVYKQGSQLTIRWTDSLKSDSCMNLYLVRDQAGAAPTYITQINRGYGCVSPASAGSFTWAIPRKYSGTGFRILLSPPGVESNALTVLFQIVP